MRFLASFVVVLVGVSLGCGATPDSGDRDGSETSDRPSGSRPPQSTLSYGGETVSGALGTYCWVSVCVDKLGVPVNEEALRVPAGEYVVAVFVRVPQGDALYGFRVVVE